MLLFEDIMLQTWPINVHWGRFVAGTAEDERQGPMRISGGERATVTFNNGKAHSRIGREQTLRLVE